MRVTSVRKGCRTVKGMLDETGQARRNGGDLNNSRKAESVAAGCCRPMVSYLVLSSLPMPARALYKLLSEHQIFPGTDRPIRTWAI